MSSIPNSDERTSCSDGFCTGRGATVRSATMAMKVPPSRQLQTSDVTSPTSFRSYPQAGQRQVRRVS
jgi:hypothetical protein